jgi:hypothetical protein
VAARGSSRAALSVVAAGAGPGRLRVQRIGTASVARVALFVQLLVTAAVMIAAAAVYIGLWAAGGLSRLEHLIQSLFGFTSFRFLPLPLFLGLALAGIVLSLVGTALAALGAVAYNLVAARFGGVELSSGERHPAQGIRRPLV